MVPFSANFAESPQEFCSDLIDGLNHPSRLQRLYAARAAAECTGEELGDALSAILLGDDPEVQKEALHSAGPFLKPSMLVALVSYGEAQWERDSPYLSSPIESLDDMPSGFLQERLLVVRHIHTILEENPQMGMNDRLRLRLHALLKHSLYAGSSIPVDPITLRLACFSLDSLALSSYPAQELLEYVEKEKQDPTLLGCGLYALSRYEWSTSDHNRRVDQLANQALEHPGSAHAARLWYAKAADHDSLSRLLLQSRSLLPFSDPLIRSVARRLPGQQGKVLRRTAVYSHPYEAGPVLRILPEGEAVDVLRESRTYLSAEESSYLIRTRDGMIGWISSRHLHSE